MRTLLFLFLISSIATFAAPPRPTLDLACVSFGSGPMLECTARIRAKDNKPLSGAKIALNASMPSMPMAHTLTPVAMIKTGQAGEYRGILQLEMHGVWAIAVDVSGPIRERFVRRLLIEPCEGNRRCAAIAPRNKAPKS